MAGTFSYFVDWDDSLTYASTGADVTARVDGPAGITFSRGKDQIRQFAPPAAGSFLVRLFNQSRDYSPGNTSSPLFSQLFPGHRVRVVYDGTGSGGGSGDALLLSPNTGYLLLDDGVSHLLLMGGGGGGTGTRNIFTGVLIGLPQHPERVGPARVSVDIPALGMTSRLRGKKVSTALYENITTSDALGHLLDAADWPAGERSIQTGLTVMSHWVLDRADAFSALEEIRATEGPASSVYENGDGWIVFENRDARTTQTRSTTSQATYQDTVDIVAVSHDLKFDDVISAAVLTVVERETAGRSVIWELGSTLTLTSGQVYPIQVRGSDWFTGALLPSPAPSDTVQTLTPSATLTAGQFQLKFRDEMTGLLDWNDTAADIQVALGGLLSIGSGNISCFGGPLNSGPVSCAFMGAFAGQAITDLIEVVDSTLNPVATAASIVVTEDLAGGGIFLERQSLRPSTTLTGGSFTITKPAAGTTGAIAYNATAPTIQTAIRTLSGWSTATCSNGPINLTPVTCFLGTGGDEPLMEIGGVGVTGSVASATLNVAISINGGVADYVVTAGSVSFALNRTSGASCQLTLTAGASGATVMGLRLQANLVPVVRSHQVSFPEDTSSIPEGKIFNPPAVRAEISRDDAQAYLQMLVERYQTPRMVTEFQIMKSATDPAVFDREIGDMITIVESQTGINHFFHIERITFDIPDGLNLVPRFGCEKTAAGF